MRTKERRLVVRSGISWSEARWCAIASRTAADGLRSTFAPPDAGPSGTGRNGWGRDVTAKAIPASLVLVTGDDRVQAGMGEDLRGAAAATCKIAGIAYTGSNPVPATHL
jgi:hypothetical protein